MKKIKNPMKDFYENGLFKAKQNGYKWVISLVARSADIDGILYKQLWREWMSLDSVTGKDFLFVVACNENNFVVSDEEFYYDFENDYSIFKRIVEANQTKAADFFKENFNLKESQIPCVVITSLHTEKNYIVSITGNSFYNYFKKLKSSVEENALDLEMLERDLEYCGGINKFNHFLYVIERNFIKGEIYERIGDERKMVVNQTNNNVHIENSTITGDIIKSIENLPPTAINNDTQQEMNQIFEILNEIKIELENGNKVKASSKMESLKLLLNTLPDCISIVKILFELIK